MIWGTLFQETSTWHSNVAIKMNEPSQLGIGLPLSQEKPQARVAACDLAQWGLVLLQGIIDLILEFQTPWAVSSISIKHLLTSQYKILYIYSQHLDSRKSRRSVSKFPSRSVMANGDQSAVSAVPAVLGHSLVEALLDEVHLLSFDFSLAGRNASASGSLPSILLLAVSLD